MIRSHPLLGMLLAGVLLVGGCASPRTSNYYVLVALPPSAAPAGDAAKGPAVVLSPISLPGYLDRPQIVSSRDPGQLELAGRDRWSEDLDENATRVLAEDLAERLPSERVGVLRPESAATKATRLAVEVSRFEREADGSVSLVARWSLRRHGQAEAYLVRRSSIRAITETDDTAGTVLAMSRALAELADEIAKALQPGHASATIPSTSQSAG